MTVRSLVLSAAVLAIAVAVAGAGAWWFLIRDEASLATAPPAIPDELISETATPDDPTATAAAGESGDVLTFAIVAGESRAAYFVDEELASLGLPSTAKGVTDDITGEFHLTADGSALAEGYQSQFTVGLTDLTSDESRRDNRVQEALETSLYPAAVFTISGVSGYDPAIAEGEQQTLSLTGTLDLHGVQREVTWEVEAFREGNVISALATVTISFADFDITAPTFAGLVSIDDEATLQVELIAQAA